MLTYNPFILDPACKNNTTTPPNNDDALSRVSPSVSALPRVLNYVPAPKIMPPDDVTFENKKSLTINTLQRSFTKSNSS